MSNSKYDVELASAAGLADARSYLADIATRRTTITAQAETHRENLADAESRLASLSATLAATGKHDALALAAAQSDKKDSEPQVAGFAISLGLLSAEEAKALDFLAACQRLKDADDKRLLVEKARDAARKLDEVSALFNEAFVVWADAKSAAGMYSRGVGLGWEATASLNYQIRHDLALCSSLNDLGSVVALTN